ncbi:MAG: 2,5-diamino-6-(ribosylamino)-4(3H)-pyrimidinone 5'-phosphate reductase [Methanosaeta sp. NSM2]|nr:2,5-diamino-6-(ribosylamino)-4(3H)-pyrimidinone 5'-phosphate reductase [Methanothrix sp.]OYV14252.1 MAG: 2,5-diamino-6-(ribosylamino)-4(3H)-pyrimidinone 5'-phosphate reductase [Methanosaeta sp. NSM2]
MTRPFVFINCAMSADGKISSVERRQVRISGREDLARVDRLRAESDAVMVGIGTVLADDPSLRVKSDLLRQARRGRGQPENPQRIVADSRARTPPLASVLGPGCILAVARSAPAERLEDLSQRSDIICCGEERVDLRELFSHLYERGIKRIMVEGGSVDEIYVFVGSMLIGGASAPTLLDGDGYRKDFPALRLVSVQRLDEGVLLKWTIPGGSA